MQSAKLRAAFVTVIAILLIESDYQISIPIMIFDSGGTAIITYISPTGVRFSEWIIPSLGANRVNPPLRRGRNAVTRSQLSG